MREAFQNRALSGKLKVLEQMLSEWREELGTKVLIFSQGKKMLDIVGLVLGERKQQFLRIDGEVGVRKRLDIIDQFNKPCYFALLLTTRVGGLGINLTAANKVVIIDPDWNPMVDIQATERAMRIGQKREVAIYRFVLSETVEEKIYHRQVFKQFLAQKVRASAYRADSPGPYFKAPLQRRRHEEPLRHAQAFPPSTSRR